MHGVYGSGRVQYKSQKNLSFKKMRKQERLYKKEEPMMDDKSFMIAAL